MLKCGTFPFASFSKLISQQTQRKWPRTVQCGFVWLNNNVNVEIYWAITHHENTTTHVAKKCTVFNRPLSHWWW
jgi:hypothetical protein